MNKMKIAIIIPSLGRGGAEKVASQLSLQFSRLQHDVTTILFDGSETGYPYGGELLDLNLPSSERRNILGRGLTLYKRMLSLKRIYREQQFDKIIAFMESAAFPSILTGFPTIVSNHCNPRALFSPWEWLLARLLYPKAKQVIVVSQQGQAIFEQTLGLKNLSCIYNPIDQQLIVSKADEPPQIKIDGDYIIAVARLEQQKRLDRLLRAYAASKLKDSARLLILGEGSIRNTLQAQAHELGINEQLIMPGNIANPLPNMKQAKFMVLSSDHEGFPMVLIEMLGIGNTAISTDCDTGPREIIQHKENGLLVPVNDEVALTATMDSLYTDPVCYQHLISNAQASVAHLSVKHIAQQWLAL